VLLTNAFDQGLRFSIDKATFELLYLPIPSAIKNNVKSTIDLIINRIADGVGGILLGIATQGFNFYFFSVNGAGLGLRGIAAMCVVGIAAWIVVAQRLRSGYLEAIRDSIHSTPRRRAWSALLDRSVDQLRRGCRPAIDDILYALDVLPASTSRRCIRRAIPAGQPVGTRQATRPPLLDDAADVAAIPGVEQLLRDPTQTRTPHITRRWTRCRDPEVGAFPDYSSRPAIAFSQPAGCRT
jgi:hypothetical protein